MYKIFFVDHEEYEHTYNYDDYNDAHADFITFTDYLKYPVVELWGYTEDGYDLLMKEKY